MTSSLYERKRKEPVKRICVCPTCSKEYENRTGKKRYCSKECWPRETKNCIVCETEFLALKKAERWCSVKCRKITSSQKVEAIKSQDPTMIKCEMCHTSHKQLASHLHNKHKISVPQYLEQFPNAKTVCETTSQKYRERLAGENNPWFNHGGTLSSFSRKNKKYANMSEEDKDVVIKRAIDDYIKTTLAENRPMNVQYWINRGLSEEEAAAVVSKRQSTFSLAKCIEKHGEEEGKAKWAARQEKWLKNYKKTNYSKVSQLLFKALLEKEPAFLEDAIFANRFNDDENAECTIKTPSGSFKPDFYVASLSKVIEFDGDYWHGQNGTTNIARDAARDAALQQVDLKIYHVKERDYRKNKEETVNKCLAFLKS